jgi:transketolase
MAKFLVPDGVRERFHEVIRKRGLSQRWEWLKKFDDYKTKYPELADHLYKMQHRQLPTGWDRDRPKFPADPKDMAGRDASGKILNALAKNVPWLIGGSADLAPSTKTRLIFDGAGDFHFRESLWTQPPLRRPRACDEIDIEWTLALQGSPVCIVQQIAR